MKDLVRRRGLSECFEIASAGTSNEEYGNPLYPPAQAKLRQMGIPFDRRGARKMEPRDYGRYDHILVMEPRNADGVRRICGGDPEGKISLLLAHAGRPGEAIADPWYTGDFDRTWDDLLAGCEGLLDELAGEGPQKTKYRRGGNGHGR